MDLPKVRQLQAGVTLVEVLVVLVLIGVMASVVGLSLGSVGRSGAVTREAQLLIARLNRAADEAVLTGAPVAFVWTEDAYKFLSLTDENWDSHPIAVLGTPHALDDGVRFDGDAAMGGEFVVLASLRPAGGTALTLTLGNTGQAQILVFDGANARILDPEGL